LSTTITNPHPGPETAITNLHNPHQQRHNPRPPAQLLLDVVETNTRQAPAADVAGTVPGPHKGTWNLNAEALDVSAARAPPSGSPPGFFLSRLPARGATHPSTNASLSPARTFSVPPADVCTSASSFNFFQSPQRSFRRESLLGHGLDPHPCWRDLPAMTAPNTLTKNRQKATVTINDAGTTTLGAPGTSLSGIERRYPSTTRQRFSRIPKRPSVGGGFKSQGLRYLQ